MIVSLLSEVASGSGRRLGEVWRDWITMAAISFANAVDWRPAVRGPREDEYMRLVKRYSAEQAGMFGSALAALTDAAEASGEPTDLLGSLTMALELGRDELGQYFSPPEVCALTARLTFADVADRVAAQGFVTVDEPAVGGGGKLLAAAAYLAAQGINYQTALWVRGVDTDRVAALTAFVQLSLYHVPGIIVVGNSLSLECREVWYTPAHVLGGWGPRLALDAAKRGRSLALDSGFLERVAPDPQPLDEQPSAAETPPAPSGQTELDFG